MIPLDDSITMIELHFRISLWRFVPRTIRKRRREPATRNQKHGISKGDKIAGPIRRCMVKNIHNLHEAGYELADAFFEKHHQSVHPMTYYAVRYIFQRKNDEESARESGKDSRVLQELSDMCTKTFWTALVYVNPLLQNGERETQNHALNIHLKGMKPVLSRTLLFPLKRQRNANQKRSVSFLQIKNNMLRIERRESKDTIRGGLES